MANRLAFDIGLHTGYTNGICKPDSSVRRRVMNACILYDRHWALFLGRPTSIKPQDINLGQAKGATSARRSSESSPRQTNMQNIEEEIHEQLVNLMDLGSQMMEANEKHQTPDLAVLKQQLQNWHKQLPDHLKWEPDTIRTAPCSYFLLHEQYQTITILMHRLHDSRRLETSDSQPSNPKGVPAKRRFSNSSDETDSHDFATPTANTEPESAHNPCIQAALQLAQIIAQFKQRYDLEKVCCTGLHPAGAASMALLTAIATSDKDGADRRLYLSSLEVITDGIRSMARSYEPAARMGDLIQVVLARIHPDARKTRISPRDPAKQGANICAGGAEPGCRDAQIPSFSAGSRNHILRSNKRPCRFPTQGSSSSSSSEPHRPTPLFQMPFDLCSQIPLDHTLTSMSELIPAFSDPSYLCLDPYFDPALKVDNSSNSNSNMGPPTRFSSSDTYLRVASSAKGWGLHSLHAATAAVNQHSASNNNNTTTFDSHMADWIAGSGLDNDRNDDGALREAGFHVPDTAILGSAVQRKNNTSSLSAGGGASGCKREDTGGLVWGLSSASPEGFNAGMGDVAVQPRNHELDFLSL